MSTTTETKAQTLRRNIIAGSIVGLIVIAAAIGTPVIVAASNAAHAAEIQRMDEARAASKVVRADAARAETLAASAKQAGVIARQEAAAQAAAAKAAAEAAAQAAAAQAAQEAQAQAAQQDTEKDSNTGSEGDQGAPAASAGLPAGAPVPSIPGTDAPDTTQCASGTASTVNGTPICD